MTSRSNVFGLVLAVAVLVLPMHLAARQSGAVEFGTFGQGTKFDAAMGFENTLGAGVHFGWAFMSAMGIEADVGFGNSTITAGGETSALSARGRFMLTPGAGSINLLLGVGGVYNSYDYAPGAWETGVTALAGFQARLAGPLRLRVAGVADYMPSTVLPTGQTTNTHLGAQIGLSVKLRPGGDRSGSTRVADAAPPQGPSDADGDGVQDGRDQCPGTATGTLVDGSGCPVPPPDADRDGVPNADDQCANSPAGAAVDARGCPLPPPDSDGDGVPDPADQCANTAAGTSVTSTGCPVPPVPPADSDGDGVPDTVDQCANTPAGTAVTSNGCTVPPAPPADSDGDGVPDTADQCANTPLGTAVTSAGCPVPPTDSDGDGVPDTADRCANTPLGAAVGADGCGVRPIDSDGDGVPDVTDQCPGTPPGTPVQRNGCPRPPPDTDLDGVPDPSDRCPSTVAGTEVGPDGCPVPEPEPEPEPEPVAPPVAEPPVAELPVAEPPVAEPPARAVEPAAGDAASAVALRGVRFVRNSDGITFPVEPVLNALADSLNALPAGRWEIAAHTDEGSSPEASLDLTQRRANEIRNYLIGRGVAPDRLVARGYGRAEMDGRARRVELRPVN